MQITVWDTSLQGERLQPCDNMTKKRKNLNQSRDSLCEYCEVQEENFHPYPFKLQWAMFIARASDWYSNNLRG